LIRLFAVLALEDPDTQRDDARAGQGVAHRLRPLPVGTSTLAGGRSAAQIRGERERQTALLRLPA